VEIYFKLDCDVVFITTESKFSIKEFVCNLMEDRKDIRFNIPIMSDFNYKISEKFLVYDELNGCCADSTFIINNQGIIKTKTVGEYSLQLNEIIRLIQAFQFSDKYNVVCQSKWIKGKKGVSLYLNS